MKPNILLCMSDQLRAFELGCSGNPVIRTPHLDRLASQGVRFETAVTTFPVCMAARSVTLSGQYNRLCTGGVGNVGTVDEQGHIYMPQYPDPGRPHLKDPTLPELLREQGYRTAAIGKWHIHSWPQEVGFDSYLIPRVHHCHTGQHYTENGGPEFIPPGYSPDFECERVERFLQDQAGSSQPFFLFYNISPPHCPLSDAPEKYLKMYSPESIPLRPNVDLGQRLPDQEHWLKVYRWDFRYYNFHLPYTEDLHGYDLRRAIAEYYGLVTWVDDCAGRMLAALEQNGLAENTILVFTSDHGDYLGSHNRVQKGDLHEEAVRIPLLLRWPGRLLPGVISGQVAGLVDIAPTLLDLIEAEIPAHMHGRSLAPVLGGQAEHLERDWSAQDWAVIETGSGVGIRTPAHLYGLPFQPGTRSLAAHPHYFFDLQNDPTQLHNLAGSGEQADLAQALDERLRAWDRQIPWIKMDLHPYIASYSAQSSAAIRQVLDRRALEMIARVAEAPARRAELDEGLCDELIEMHVFREQDGLVRLETAVFLEEDIRRINAAASRYGQELAGLVIPAAAPLRGEPPTVVNFLIGIVAIGQSLHHTMKAEGSALDWKSYTGRYAQSKVDFDQVCDSRQALGADLQNKNVLRGEQFTAVFIGPGGQSYLLHADQAASPGEAETLRQLNLYLTDAYAQLLSGQIDHPALRSAAAQAGLFRDGAPDAFVLTNAAMANYLPTIQAVGQITHTYNAGQFGALRELLASTASGRQGVPPENMSMHLWRYIRRAIAREMYARGFFTDSIPETGLITVFFENNVEILNDLLQ